jgi:hypothetical protein
MKISCRNYEKALYCLSISGRRSAHNAEAESQLANPKAGLRTCLYFRNLDLLRHPLNCERMQTKRRKNVSKEVVESLTSVVGEDCTKRGTTNENSTTMIFHHIVCSRPIGHHIICDLV